MRYTEIGRKKFEFKKDAVAWAKSEKKKAGRTSGIKWETNRLSDPSRPWEAVLYREVK